MRNLAQSVLTPTAMITNIITHPTSSYYPPTYRVTNYLTEGSLVLGDREANDPNGIAKLSSWALLYPALLLEP